MQFLFSDKTKYTNTKWLSRKYNREWKKFAGRKWIGDCSKLFQRLNPISYTDFYIKYVNDGEKNKNNNEMLLYRGRTEDEICNIAKAYQSECKRYDIPLETFILNVICHTIHETYDGQIVERNIGQMLNKMNYIYKKPEGNEDSVYGIDFKVYDNSGLKFILQIKPKTFFIGNRNKSLIDDRKNAFIKERDCNEKYGCKVYYIVYSIDNTGNVNLYKDNNGKMCHNLSFFCNVDGYVINPINNI